MASYKSTKAYKNTIRKLGIIAYFRGALDAVGWDNTITELCITECNTYYFCLICLDVGSPLLEHINTLNDALYRISKGKIEGVRIHPQDEAHLDVFFQINDKSLFKDGFYRDADTLLFSGVFAKE